MQFSFSRKFKFFWLVLVCLYVTSLLSACGDSSPMQNIKQPAATNAPSGTNRATSTTAAASTTSTHYTVASTTAAATTAAASTTSAAFASDAARNAAPGQSALPATTPLISERKIIRNASLNIQVNDIEESLTKLRKLAVEQGGFIFSENTNQYPDSLPKALIVLQVPAEAYETTVNRIRFDSVKVLKHESSSQDVTEEFIDVQGQIVNLRKTEESIQKLLDKTTTLNEIVSLQRELTAIRGEIERRQGRLNFLDKKSSLSTISVDLSLVPAPVPTSFATTAAPVATARPVAWQPEKTVSDSWDDSLNLLGGFATKLLRVLVFSWWLLPFVVIAFFIVRSRLAIRKQRAAMKSITSLPSTPPAAPVAESEDVEAEVLLKK